MNVKKLAKIILCLVLVLAAALPGAAPAFAEGEKASGYSYKTSTLKGSDTLGTEKKIKVKLTVPNYLGKITVNINATDFGSMDAEMLVVYVPSDKWDGECYYSGITGKISSTGPHVLSASSAVINWIEFYSHGFIAAEGGLAVSDSDALQLNFLKGAGLYSAFTSIPYTASAPKYPDYDSQYAADPSSVKMTAAGYPFLLVLDDEAIENFLSTGHIGNGTQCKWEGLKELLESRRYELAPESSDSGLANFVFKNYYSQGFFSDVPHNDTSWYVDYVMTAYRLGFMKGDERGFGVSGNMTIAEAITIAARMHNIFYGGNGEFTQGEVWYDIYESYCLKHGIIKETDFYGQKIDKAAATREQMAYIFANALPSGAFKEINVLPVIPDVNSRSPYASYIYTLYKAGVLQGDENHNFRPSDSITRAEVAAIISRMAIKTMRIGYR